LLTALQKRSVTLGAAIIPNDKSIRNTNIIGNANRIEEQNLTQQNKNKWKTVDTLTFCPFCFCPTPILKIDVVLCPTFARHPSLYNSPKMVAVETEGEPSRYTLFIFKQPRQGRSLNPFFFTK
jgi:hypothetical protein